MSSPDKFLKRIPPVSKEAEDWIISCLLLDPTLIGSIAEIIGAEDFYQDRNRMVFSVMVELERRGVAATLTTITDHLKEQGNLDKVGYTWITGIAESAISTAFYKDHAHVIREKSLVRKILNQSLSVAERCYEDHESAEGFLDEVESELFQLSLRNNTRRIYTMDELALAATERMDALRNNRQALSGVPSGLIALDKQLGGFQAGDLIIVGARPSLGKTALTMGFLNFASMKHNIPSLFFSLEMSKEQVAMRAISSHARIDNARLRTGYLSQADFGRIAATIYDLREAPIFVDDTPGNTILTICSTAKRMKREKNIGIIGVDYIQLVKSQQNKREENRATELGTISKRLKALAKELQVPILVLSQLNRQVEMRGGNKRPQYSDIKESGSMEEDADVILLIYRDDFYNADSKEPGTAEIIIAKNRNGPTGSVQVTFRKEYTRFDNLALPGEEPYEMVEDF